MAVAAIIVAAAAAVMGGVFTAMELADKVERAGEEGNAQIDEINRQRRELEDQEQEQKAERIAEADRQHAQVVAAMAELGGGGMAANEARFIGEVGGMEGLDLARIAGNANRQHKAMYSQQSAIHREVIGVYKDAKMAEIANHFNTGKNVASAIFSGGSSMSSQGDIGAGYGNQGSNTINQRFSGMFGGAQSGTSQPTFSTSASSSSQYKFSKVPNSSYWGR